MAFGKFSLLGLVVVLSLMYSVNGIRHDRSNFGEEEEGEYDRFIFKKESSWKRIDSEAGQVRVVPVFGKSTSRTQSSLHNYELNCIEMDPNSLLVPQYMNAHWYLYVYQGKARIGWVHNQRLIEQDLETGQIYYVPKGSSFYVINTDTEERLHLINLLYNEDSTQPKRHHESFYVAGGENPETVLSGFSQVTQGAAFGIEGKEAVEFLSKQRRGPIVSLGQEQERGGKGQEQERGSKEQMNAELLSWPWSSPKKHKGSGEEKKKPFNLQKKKPDFTNDHGQYIEADHESFPPLERQDVAIALTRIEQGSMTAPFYHSSADAVSVVLEGSGRVEIVLPESGRESEGEMESYVREDVQLNPGDVFFVPAGYPSVQTSESKEHFEILTFLINKEHNTINFLTGKNSAWTQIKHEVLAAALGEEEQEVKKVIEAQKDERFLRGPNEPRRLSSIL